MYPWLTFQGRYIQDSADSPRMLSGSNPIDHIFQFHKALRRDLLRLEADAARFSAAVHASADSSDPAIIAKVGCQPGHTVACWPYHTRRPNLCTQSGVWTAW
jgi:hypothetical protein